jgi:hypothetical protein
MYCRSLARVDAAGFWSDHRPHSAALRISTTCSGHRELPHIMHSSVNMPSAFPISGIFVHHNTRGIIFPYLCGTDLSEIETPQMMMSFICSCRNKKYQRSQVDCFLARL